MNHLGKMNRIILTFFAIVTSAFAQQTPLKNGLLQGTLNGTPSGGTLNLSNLTLTLPAVSIPLGHITPLSVTTSGSGTFGELKAPYFGVQADPPGADTIALYAPTISASRLIELPDKDGVMAVVADIEATLEAGLDKLVLVGPDFSNTLAMIKADNVTTANKEWQLGNVGGHLPTLLFRSTGAVTVVNTTTETDLLSTEIIANAMTRLTDGSRFGSLRVRLTGTYLNNSGANRTLTLRVKFGTTTLFADTSPTIGFGAGRRRWNLDFIIQNTSASAQVMTGTFAYSTGAVPTTGTGALSAVANTFVIGGTSSENTTSLKTIAVSARHSLANASLEIVCDTATIELLP
jgi:hypothetical protein